MSKKLLYYTRTPLDSDIYSGKLADSMHLAVERDGKFIPLNNNYGVLFAKAAQREDGILLEMTLSAPFLFRNNDGTFTVVAIRCAHIRGERRDDETSRGYVLVYTSADLIHYSAPALLKLSDEYIRDITGCEYCDKCKKYKLSYRTDGGEFTAVTDFATAGAQTESAPVTPSYDFGEISIEGALPRGIIELEDAEADYLYKKLTTPHNTAIILPDNIAVSSRAELDDIRVTAVYSDGTSAKKRVDWYDRGCGIDTPDFSVPGVYHIKGRVHQDRYEFPLAWGRADPFVGRFEGKYYFVATNEFNQNHTISIRQADTLSGIVTAQESVILDTKTYPHIKGLLWAPELHVINGRLYMFHAATRDEFANEQAHVTALKPGGNPMIAGDWEIPRRVVKAAGSELNPLGITLDMTEFEVGGRCYAIWSSRRYNPVDFGAWLYIAEIDPLTPWRLISEPQLISMPEFSWANNHSFVDEGPYPLLTDRKIFVTFSSSSIDSTYVVGLLSADYGSDLLDPASWTKENYPLLTSASVAGEFGPGHNAYVTDDDGVVYNIYHGRRGSVRAPRCAGFRRVHFDTDGYPVLNLTEELDLAPELADIETDIRVI